jgi:hypothetical protein
MLFVFVTRDTIYVAFAAIAVFALLGLLIHFA